MRRIRIFNAAVLFGCWWLPAQSLAQALAPTLTVINDASWSNSATALDLSRARLPAPSARLSNVSIRARAGTGAATLIAGAVVQGSGSLPMLVRAIGPGLTRFGVSDILRAPKLEIFRGNTLAAQTNTVGTGVTAASAYVGAFPPLESTGGLTVGDAALVGQVSAGTLTAHCSSATEASGVALLEFYDATAAPSGTSARFVNLSARARVETGESIIVIGFVVAGEGNIALLLRGVGASLEQFGVADFLRDPLIELYAGNVRIAANDNWRSGDQNAVGKVEAAQLAAGAFTLTSPNDAALLVTLPAGAYTLQVRGVGGLSGEALAEIQEIAGGGFDAAEAVNAVGLDLYRELTQARPGETVIVSPYSIESALALAYVGADGDTRDEMARVLRFPADNAQLQAGFAGLRRGLEIVAEDSVLTADARTRAGTRTDSIAWSAANRLFGQQDYAFRDSFLTLMRDGFAAPFQALDFRTNAEGSRVTINTWVEDQTRQKILNLIPAGGVTEGTRLVLVNALYLKAPWDTPFSKFNTTARTFRPATGGSREVPTMQRTAFLGYTVEDGLTVVTLDYLGSGLQFVVALPDEGLTVDAAAARLTPAHFARWAKMRDTSAKNVALYLPKFRAEGATVPLGSALRTLGVKQAFDVPRGSANFDRIAPRRPDDYLAISDVFHQTFVALDEEGTEAAAATAVVVVVPDMAVIGPPTIEVRIDRPFFFAIQHRASGVCLFFGRVMDPR